MNDICDNGTSMCCFLGPHTNCVTYKQQEPNMVDHPPHYKQVPGVECIEVTEHFSFLRGNAIKYLWRAGAKGDTVQDLRKSIWYIEREIANLERGTDD